jgi:hypothetical protein
MSNTTLQENWKQLKKKKEVISIIVDLIIPAYVCGHFLVFKHDIDS